MKPPRSTISFLLLASILMLLTLCCALLASCNNDDAPPVALVIVIGKHANQNAFSDDSYSTVKSLVARAVYGGKVDIIIADGKPRRIEILDKNGKPQKFAQDANNNKIKKARIDSYADTVLAFLQSEATCAVYPEVDLLAAIVEAERALHDSTIGEKYIIVMDTGVSTTGRVDLHSLDIDNKETSDIIAAFKEQAGILPNLTGYKIHFIGFGDVAEPQILPDITRPKLEALWREVFIACGALARDIKIHVSPSGARPNHYSEDEGGFPFVSAVQFEFKPMLSPTVGESSLILPDVGFFADSSEFLDQDKAKNILASYADAIIAHLEKNPDKKLYLLGTSATVIPGGEGDIELSQKRANMLKDALTELNVPASRLISLGVGARVPAALRVNEFRDGRFDSSLAQANRKATIYEGDDEDFLEILAFNDIDIDSLK